MKIKRQKVFRKYIALKFLQFYFQFPFINILYKFNKKKEKD